MPDEFGGIAVEEPQTDEWGGVAVEDAAPVRSPDFSKIKLDASQMLVGPNGVKRPSGMESGTEFTTALAGGAMRAAAAVPPGIQSLADIPSRIARGVSMGQGHYSDASLPLVGEERKAQAEGFGEAISKPIVPLDIFKAQTEADDPAWASAVKSAERMLISIPEFVESPLGILTMGAGLGGKAATTAVRYGFAADMLKNMFQQAPQLRDNWKDMTANQQAEAITQFLGTAAMVGLLTHPEARGAVKNPLANAADRMGQLAPDAIRLSPGGRPVFGAAVKPPISPEMMTAPGGAVATQLPPPGIRPPEEAPRRVAPAPATAPPPVSPPQPLPPKSNATGELLRKREGAKPHPQQALLDDIIQEGVKRSDAEALLAGTKTVKQVVDENLDIVTPSRDFSQLADNPDSDFGHSDAMEEGYTMAIARLERILGLDKVKPTPKPTAPAGAAATVTHTLESVGKLTPTEFFDTASKWSKDSMAGKGMGPQRMAEAAARANPDLAAWQKAAADAATEFKKARDEVKADPKQMMARQKELMGLAQRSQFYGEGIKEINKIKPVAAPAPAAPAPAAPAQPSPAGIGGGIKRAMQQGRQGEAGFVAIPGVEAVLDRVVEQAADLPAGVRRAWRSASMQSLPRITDANRLAGEAGVRLDASRAVARAKGIEFAGKVTEGVKDKTFDLKFGTALTEDNLRDLKRQHEERARMAKDPAEALAAKTQADAVSTMIGQPNSPFKTEADYQKFMRTPEAQQALAKHIKLWQSDKDPIFRQAMDLDPDQPLPTRGAQFGARVNLKNVQRDQGTKTTVGPNVRGSLIRATATLKRKDPFGQKAKGSGSYEGSYQEIMANGFEREYPVAKQHEFIKELIKGGDAKLSKREFDPESEIKGESTKGYPLKMKPWAGQYLQIRKSLASEYEDVSGLSAAVRAGPYSAVADALTKSSIMGLSEGSTHAGNLLTQVFTGLGPSSNPLINALIKSAGRADVVYSLPKVIINAFSDRKSDMLRLAEIGAAKEPYRGAIGWFITKIDKGVRLYSADVYKNMAKAGWVEDTETGLREYVNQVGQYSKRLQPRWIQVLRSTGVQPFATAMQNFNVQGLRTMVAAPGAKAPTNWAALALRADKAASILGFAVLVTALNYLVSGDPTGPKGTKLGAIGWIGDDGKLHQFDAGMLTGMTRGARITGAQGFVEAKRSGLGTGSALLAGAQGVGNTAISAATGPANRFGFMAITGKRPSIPLVQEAPVAVPQAEEDFSVLKSQVAKNVMEALKQANPVVDAAIRLKQGKYEEALTRQLSRYTPRTGMATETIEALPKIVAAGELNNYVDALAKEARKQPLGFERNTFIREKMDEDNIDPSLRAKAMQELQRKGVFKYQ